MLGGSWARTVCPIGRFFQAKSTQGRLQALMRLGMLELVEAGQA
jgi:hypothetical protein